MKNKTPRLLSVILAVAIAAGACSSSDEANESLILDPTETTTATAPTTAVAPTTETTSAAPSTDATTETASAEVDLQTALDSIVEDTGVPALGAAIFDSNGLVEISASGVRQNGSDAKVTTDDRFHLGSNTKAMTAALFARLEEQGSGVTYETTLGEAFPAVDVHADYATVTLAQLMRHSGGVPAEPDVPESIVNLPVTEARAQGAGVVLSQPPEIAPGTLARYSNSNYVLVGAALEASTEQSWEELMTAEVFEPLSMDSCGFGPPGVEGQTNEPRGHDRVGSAVFDDNPPALGPAGTVHCSMPDWGTFLVELLNATKGESDFLSQGSAARLFEPSSVPVEGIAGAQNALGWLVLDDPEGPVYWHNGSNTLWYSQAVINPAADGVILTVTNQAASGQQAADMAFELLVDRYTE